MEKNMSPHEERGVSVASSPALRPPHFTRHIIPFLPRQPRVGDAVLLFGWLRPVSVALVGGGYLGAGRQVAAAKHRSCAHSSTLETPLLYNCEQKRGDASRSSPFPGSLLMLRGE